MAERRISDAELSRRCRQDDPKAWRMLVRRVTPLVYRVALRMLSTREEAEDASQEVMLRIHKSFNTFDPTRPLAPWVGRITYNVCLRRFRGVAREGFTMDPEDLNRYPAPQSASPEDQTASREAGDLLLEAMDHLSAQDRAILTLRYREGLSDAEVAEAIDMPVNTVKTRLFRARGALRRRLKPTLRGRS